MFSIDVIDLTVRKNVSCVLHVKNFVELFLRMVENMQDLGKLKINENIVVDRHMEVLEILTVIT